VQETATRWSAQPPAPISGVSPTRPGSLPNTPPVEVAAASRPSWSRTTHPTVPCASVPGGWFDSSCPAWVNQAALSAIAASFWSAANRAAPSPASMTCGVQSMIARATATGLSNPCSAATEPARPVNPSIRQASSSYWPTVLGEAPRPAT